MHIKDKPLTEAQIAMLQKLAGTTRENPFRRTSNGYFVEDISLLNPTAQALERRGLAQWRGYDGKSPGGWFLTRTGRDALDTIQVNPRMTAMPVPTL